MQRKQTAERPNWRARVEADGLVFHSTRDAGQYWGEGTYYELTEREADAIEAATSELHRLCLDAVAHVVERGRYEELDLDPLAAALVERSWREQPPSLYGRFDLAFGDGVPKLLEYNADTPTSLLEAAVIQWRWCSECAPDADQWTLLHERLIATWRRLAPQLGEVVHFAHVDDVEDAMTVAYLRDTAEQAGVRTVGLVMEDIGWDDRRGALVDLDDRPIETLFKLYPWEGLVLDELADEAVLSSTRWLEPAWKMVLSNKAILPILWELNPGHPNLLPASREPLPTPYAKKPLFGREGANVSIVTDAGEVTTAGPYDDRGFVYQQYADLGEHDGMRPVIGSWIIGGAPAGIGIREAASYVTSNVSRFAPHVVR